MAAPKGNKNAIGNSGGRKIQYRSEYSDQVYRLALLGLLDKDIASFFRISERTLNRWKKIPEFWDALNRGKIIANANVAERLYQRAMGYQHPEDKIFLHEGRPVIVPTIKHYAPDPTSIIFYLKNREKSKWRDRHENVIDIKSQLEKMSEEDLEKLAAKIIEQSSNDE